jgi:hypothetical protein
MKKTKNLLTATMISLVTGFAIAITMNGCNKPSATAPILPGNEFLTTILMVISDPAHIQPTDTVIWSETPSQTVPDTSHSFVTLKQNYAYNTQIIILDSTKCDTCDGFVVSSEIISRENYHLFCFYDQNNTNDIYGTTQSSRANTAWANVTITNPNYDSNNPPLPFGITDNLNTFGPTNGQLEVILRHQPDVKNGQCAPGSTDFDVYYNIKVQ